MARKQAAGLFFYLVSSLLPVTSIAAGSEEIQSTLIVVPEQIRIGAFYHGAELQISSNSAFCDGAVVVMRGDNKEITLNRKGRMAIIWMNVAKITISGVPGVYIMASSDKLDNICSRETQEKLRLGLESLRDSMDISSDKPLTGAEFDQFLELKVDNGTYNTNNIVELKSIPTGKTEISAILPIPSEIPPGIYEINLYCFRQGKVVESNSARLKIDRIGLPCAIKNLAEKNAAMYGLMAIVAAMLAGVIIGIVFSSLPRKRRRY